MNHKLLSCIKQKQVWRTFWNRWTWTQNLDSEFGPKWGFRWVQSQNRTQPKVWRFQRAGHSKLVLRSNCRTKDSSVGTCLNKSWFGTLSTKPFFRLQEPVFAWWLSYIAPWVVLYDRDRMMMIKPVYFCQPVKTISTVRSRGNPIQSSLGIEALILRIWRCTERIGYPLSSTDFQKL